VDAPLPSGGELEVRRLRELLEASLFERERDGVHIGRFAVLDRLGAGGMGVVYAAYDPGLDRKVAVKVLRREGDARARAQLVEEARALARLSHPSIVTVHEVGEHEGQVFLAMEHIAGEGLDLWIRPDTDGALRPWREVLQVFEAAGRGLAAAHAAQLVHRDFKPHNVMLGADGAVKVLDFGLARSTPAASAAAAVGFSGPHGPGSGSSTVTGGIAGTPAYMAPEQIAGERATERSDQFSFCVALHEALYGHRPFPGRTLEQIAFAMLDDERCPPPADSPVPGWVRAAVERGLQSDPSDRFASMHDLLAALRRDPSIRRRRIGGGALLVFAGAVAWPAADPGDRCRAAGSDIAAVWSPDNQASVRAGFEASGNPRAANTWARIEPRLDAYTRAWHDSARRACRDHNEGRATPLAYDRRSACLRTRRASVEAVVQLLEAADVDVVDRAWASVSALPELSSCESEATSESLAVPSDPALANAVAAQRDVLAKARVLEDAGRHAQARTLADQVHGSSDATTFDPLRAEAAIVRASVAMAVAPPEVSDRELGEALRVAVQSGHDRVALEALAKRAFLRAELARQPQTALDDAQLATAWLKRHDAVDDRLRWLVHNNLGVVHERSEELEAAERSHRRALQYARNRGAAGHLEAVASLTNLSLLMQRRGDGEQAVVLAERAVTLAEDTLGADHPLLPTPLMALAEAHRGAGARQAAMQAAERALSIHEGLDDHGRRLDAISPLATLAELAAEQGDHPRAQALADRAERIAVRMLGPEHPVALEVRKLAESLSEMVQ